MAPKFNDQRVTSKLKQRLSAVYHHASSAKYLNRAQKYHITGSDFSLRTTKHNIPTTLLALKYD